MLFISILLYLITSLIACKVIFQNLAFSKVIITFFIALFSINVLICEILSFINRLNNQILFILFQIIICGALSLFIWRKGEIQFREFVKEFTTPKISRDPINIISIILICWNLGVLLFVGLNTPPNNLDSLHTHLLRIYYWLQHGSFQNWSATSLAQLNYPINAHIQGLWLFLLGQREELFFLVPWFSLIVICCSVFEIARLFKLSTSQSIISCLVLLTFPVVLLQSYSFQNDLPVVALISVFIYLLISYLYSKNLQELVVALLALALSLGVKQTAFLVLPAILVFMIILIIRKSIARAHLPYLGLFVAFFLIFSSYQYIQNMVNFSSFFGVDDLVSEQSLKLQDVVEKVKYTVPRYLYSFIDFSGLGSQNTKTLIGFKSGIFKSGFGAVDINLEDTAFIPKGFDQGEQFSYETPPIISEDTAWFGPLGFLLTIVSSIIILFQKNKERKSYLLFTLLLSFSYFCAIVLQRPGWDPYQGRYFIIAILPFVPLMGVLLPQKGLLKIIGAIVIFVAFLLISFNILFLNNSRPLITSGTIVKWQNTSILKLPSRTKFQIIYKNKMVIWTNKLVKYYPQRYPILSLGYYEQLYYSNTKTVDDQLFVNSIIPENQPIYLIDTRNPIEYGLFGINRSRDLFPINSIDQVPSDSYLLIRDDEASSLSGFKLLGSNNHYWIYQRSD